MSFEVIMNWLAYFILILNLILFGIELRKILLGFFIKKQAGKLLYKDSSYNPELVMAFILALVIIVEIVINMKNNLIFWLILLPVVILLVVKGLIRLEIWEKGIFSKDGFWKWEDIKSYELEASGKLYNLKIKIKHRLHKLTVDFDNMGIMHDLMKQYVQTK